MAYIGGPYGEQTAVVAPNYTPKCGGCNSNYHGRGNCPSVAESSWYQKTADNRGNWLCNDQPSGSEPVAKKQNTSTVSAEVLFSRIAQLLEISLAPIRATQQEIVEGQRALTSQVETLRSDITTLKSRMDKAEMTQSSQINPSSADNEPNDGNGHTSSGDQDENVPDITETPDSDRDPSSPQNGSDTENDTGTKESTQKSENIYGIRINKKTSHRQSWDKQHYCKFCEKPVLKLPRHLQDRHATEPEVMEFLELPPKDAKRREIIDNIRNEGNFMHNQKVLISGTGELFTKRRQACDSKDDADLDNYIVCSICHIAVRSRSLARHRRLVHLKRKHQDPFCSETVNESDTSAHREYRKECERFLPNLNLEGVPTEFKHAVLNTMRNDPITTAAKLDELILNYGQRVFEKIDKQDKKSNAYISQKMRELARLLLSFREFVKDENRTMRSILKSEEVPNLIATVKILAEYDAETKQLKKPSLAKHCGISLKHMVSFAKEAAIEKDDKQFIEDLDGFSAAYDARWSAEVARIVVSTIKKKRSIKPPPLFHITQPQVQVIQEQRVFDKPVLPYPTQGVDKRTIFPYPQGVQQGVQEQYFTITHDIHEFIQFT